MDPAIKPASWSAVAKMGSYSMLIYFFKDLPLRTGDEIIKKGDIE